MRLKSIKLSGFKSFVDPTVINFPSNLGAVVGPNGCGKSNVIDAVRWVMGESSAKNLRGESMTDVIFNGSSARKPVGQASVELVFDNQDRKLTGEYVNYNEVAVRRKVDRDGNSVYSLNGTSCRRKDITDIFLGTGLGARSYSIIEQGMVSRLIESKPEELRIYIEEAAGISKYKERRKETERRIKRTKENLDRLSDIRDELERQLQHLKRQSVAAEKYGQLKQEERETTANLNAIRWSNLDRELKANQEKINKLQLEVESKIADQRRLDADSEKHLTENAELTDALGAVQARFYSLGNDITRIEQSIEHRIERVEQLKLDLADTEQGWKQTQEELDTDLIKITNLEEKLREVSPELETAEKSERDSNNLLTNAEKITRDWQEEWEAFNKRAEAPRQTAEVEQSRIQQLENSVGRSLQQKQNLNEELESLEKVGKFVELDDWLTQADDLENKIQKSQAEMASCSEAIEKIRLASADCSEQLNRVRRELQMCEGERSSLEALEKAGSGQDSKAIESWLQRSGHSKEADLIDELSIEPGWELAAEAVLGDSLNAICVQEAATLKTMFSELPQCNVSVVNWQENKTENNNLESKLPPLSKKIDCSWDISTKLQNVFTANSFEDAIAQRKLLSKNESIVTPDGIWMGVNWIQFRNKSAKDSIMDRREKLEKINNNINQLNSSSQNFSEEEKRLQETLKEKELQREQLQHSIVESNKQLGDLKSKISAQRAKESEAQVRKQRIQSELSSLEELLAVEEKNISQSRSNLEKALDVMADDAGVREKLEQERERNQSELQEARDQVKKFKDLSHELELRKQSVQAQLKSTRETMDRMATQVERSKERVQMLEGQIDESDEPMEDMRGQLETLLKQRLGVEKELTQAKTNLAENEHIIRGLEQKRNGIGEQLNKSQEELMQVRLESEGYSVKREGILAQLNDGGFDLAQVLERLPEDLEEEQCALELEKLSNRIQRLGPINLAAIDEHKHQSERKVFLDSQNDDLEKALNTLQNAIRKIDKETRERFKETFDKINSGLQSLFPRIFGGGQAYLDMTGDDLLDTGVAIMARPPGKRNSTIHLLSGGEKAMTAIALVFSIFHLNPSPFCMLDEVDAPLDDANVQRYANLVKEMSESVQFIFITHNKITMEMANQLLGVTMHEAGVSRMVAVDIDEAAELAAM